MFFKGFFASLLHMKQTRYISFFIILQMLVGFGLVPVISLNQMLGPLAALIYSMTSFSILSVFAMLLWYRGTPTAANQSQETGAINSLGFGMIFAFIMAEIVAVILVTKF
jgi:hypothetical protein